MELNQHLHTALTENQLHFSPEIEKSFLDYLELLAKWNQVYNLTAIRDSKEGVYLHILDSLSVNPFLQGKSIIDVGTGAGLPGIPLALVNPDKKFVLLDSNSKKTRFLTHVVHTLKIKNVEVVHSRSEDFHPSNCFDTILSRAFASLEVMLEATQHLLCKNGQFLAMKGIYPEKEVAKIPTEFKVVQVHELKMKGLVGERHLLCIEHKGN